MFSVRMGLCRDRERTSHSMLLFFVFLLSFHHVFLLWEQRPQEGAQTSDTCCLGLSRIQLFLFCVSLTGLQPISPNAATVTRTCEHMVSTSGQELLIRKLQSPQTIKTSSVFSESLKHDRVLPAQHSKRPKMWPIKLIKQKTMHVNKWLSNSE